MEEGSLPQSVTKGHAAGRLALLFSQESASAPRRWPLGTLRARPSLTAHIPLLPVSPHRGLVSSLELQGPLLQSVGAMFMMAFGGEIPDVLGCPEAHWSSDRPTRPPPFHS